MATDFHQIQARANATVMRTLCNCGGTFNGASFAGILESGFEGQSFDGFGSAGNSVRITLALNPLPNLIEGKPLEVTSGQGIGTYRVGNAYPDGTGLVTLHLLLQTTPT